MENQVQLEHSFWTISRKVKRNSLFLGTFSKWANTNFPTELGFASFKLCVGLLAVCTGGAGVQGPPYGAG